MKKIVNYHDESYRCIRCGSCQAYCPLYIVSGKEPYVARGKLRLIREMLDENLEMSPKLRHYLDLCLGCKACVVNCPAKVETDKVVMSARNHFVEQQGLPLIFHIALKHVMANPKAFALGIKSLGIFQGLKLNKILIKDLRQKMEILPPVPRQTFKQQMSGIPLKKNLSRRVGFFLSCMDNLMFPEAAKACIKVLQANDCEVIIPEDVVCCGGPHYAYGAWDTARELAEKNIRAFREADVSAIVTDCATCGSVLKSYPDYFPEGSHLQSLAKDFSAKVFDINHFLISQVNVQPGPRPFGGIVTYHEPCHLSRYQETEGAAQELLRRLKGADFKVAEEADMCCGSAGTFNINHYEESMKILSRKINNMQQTGADIFVTACPACRIQLGHGLKMAGLDIPVLYPVELLAETYDNQFIG